MIEGMKIDLIVSNSAGTQSHYMLKSSAIESLISRQRCTEPWRLCKALRVVQSLMGCTEPYRLYGALRVGRSLTG